MPRPFTPLHAVAGALLALTAGTAAAETSPWYLGAAQSFAYDSNLYRVGDGQDALLTQRGLKKSDTVSITSLVGGLDQRIGRQRLSGSGSLRANRYASNESLNNQSYAANLDWDWETVERLSGTLGAGSEQTLAQFNSRTAGSTVETRKNQVRTDRIDARAQLGGLGRWTVEASLGWRQRSYSAVEYDSSEYRQHRASLGLRYRVSGALTVGAAGRVTRATYPRFYNDGAGNFGADKLQREDIDLTAHWTPSAVSQLKLRLSPTHTSYDRATGSDFSGLTGSLVWGWQPTGKLRLDTTLSRDTGQSSDAVNLGLFGSGVTDDSRTTTALGLRANYALSAKIGLNAGARYAHRALASTVFTATGLPLATSTGSDNTTTLSLGGRWQPTRSAQLGCDLGHDRRTSGNHALSLPLSATTLSCYGQLTVQ